MSEENETLEALVAKYKENPTDETGRELGVAFSVMIMRLFEFMGDRMALVQTVETIRQCVYSCFEKIPRYDPTKGKAFNYFTTIILCQLRQRFRSHQNEMARDKKWLKFLNLSETNCKAIDVLQFRKEHNV